MQTSAQSSLGRKSTLELWLVRACSSRALCVMAGRQRNAQRSPSSRRAMIRGRPQSVVMIGSSQRAWRKEACIVLVAAEERVMERCDFSVLRRSAVQRLLGNVCLWQDTPATSRSAWHRDTAVNVTLQPDVTKSGLLQEGHPQTDSRHGDLRQRHAEL